MSSLLQHHGGHSEKGIELLCCLVDKTTEWEKYNGPDSYKPSPESTTFCTDRETYTNGKTVLYRFFRKPRGMWGCWVIFRYLGADRVPDLSVPISLFRLPRGAEKLTEAEATAYWAS